MPNSLKRLCWPRYAKTGKGAAGEDLRGFVAVRRSAILGLAMSLAAAAMAHAQPAPPLASAPAPPAPAAAQPVLPVPGSDPMRIDPAADPILRLARSQASAEQFRAIVAAAVERHPGTREYQAMTREAREVVAEAHERQLPSVDLNLTSYRVIAREFSNDPNNIIERSRAPQRTDALLSVSETLFDWGAGGFRELAAGARLRAASADAESDADRIALGAVAAWYDVFAFRALVSLSETFIANQQDLRAAVEQRITQGVSAPGDAAQVETYIASAQRRLAGFRRQLANAEARFTELTGDPPPASLERAPPPGGPAMTRDRAALEAMSNAASRSAQAQADSARQEAKAVKADRLPQLSGGIDAGRYGVFETSNDYDVRARVGLRQRLFGGQNARAHQAEARFDAADARATRIREESARDAAIAWSDVRALEQQLEALEAAYIAGRRSRDVLVERFLASRGTLFDVVASEDAYFESAAAYIQALSELDAARYVLLSRTGGLLDAMGIDTDYIGGAK
jgi:adhesin transport system outer membrane protein